MSTVDWSGKNESLSIAERCEYSQGGRESSTRDWCMFLLTFRHALRSREARQLKIADVDMENLTITIRRVKGSLVPVSKHSTDTRANRRSTKSSR
jgi:integrase